MCCIMKKTGCLTENSIKSMQKQKKCSEKYSVSEFLIRTGRGANGFRAEIVLLRPEGVYAYTERKETAIE